MGAYVFSSWAGCPPCPGEGNVPSFLQADGRVLYAFCTTGAPGGHRCELLPASTYKSLCNPKLPMGSRAAWALGVSSRAITQPASGTFRSGGSLGAHTEQGEAG